MFFKQLLAGHKTPRQLEDGLAGSSPRVEGRIVVKRISLVKLSLEPDIV